MAVRLVLDPTDGLAVTVSPLGELVAALHALDEPAHHTGVRDWAVRTRESLPSALTQDLDRHAWLWRAVRPALLLPSRRLSEQEASTIDAELGDLRATSSDDVLMAALAPLRAAPRSGTHTLDPPSEAARRRARTYARARGADTAAVVDALLHDPQRFRDHLADLLADAWQHCLVGRWDRLRPLLAAEARLLSDRAAADGPLAALIAALPAAAADGATLVLDKVPHARVSPAEVCWPLPACTAGRT